MRDIRFRAWDKINKQIIPHNLLSVGLKNIGNNDQFVYEQYTGRKDKNGKESYFGDKAKRDDDGPVFVVDWNERQCCFYLRCLDAKYPWQHMPFIEVCEIIGTIHDK